MKGLFHEGCSGSPPSFDNLTGPFFTHAYILLDCLAFLFFLSFLETSSCLRNPFGEHNVTLTNRNERCSFRWLRLCSLPLLHHELSATHSLDLFIASLFSASCVKALRESCVSYVLVLHPGYRGTEEVLFFSVSYQLSLICTLRVCFTECSKAGSGNPP